MFLTYRKHTVTLIEYSGPSLYLECAALTFKASKAA